VTRSIYCTQCSVDVKIMLIALIGYSSLVSRFWSFYFKATYQWRKEFSAIVDEAVLFFVPSQRPTTVFCPDVLKRSCTGESSLGLPTTLSKSQLLKCSSSKSSSFLESVSIFFVRSSSCCNIKIDWTVVVRLILTDSLGDYRGTRM